MRTLESSELYIASGGISEAGCSKLKCLGLIAAGLLITVPTVVLSGIVGPIFLVKHLGDSAFIIGALAAIASTAFCTCAQCFATRCIEKCCCANKTETAVTPESTTK